jgi:transcriptional regulator with XRE-family HTH domain
MTKDTKKFSDYETRYIGKKIKTLREQQGITQIDLAMKANVSIAIISKLENGLYPHKIAWKIVRDFANALNTTVGFLIGETK